MIHRDPRHYEDPDAFRPERWSGDLARRLPRFAYLPFSGGPRVCIGSRFAMMEAVLILATLVQRFSLDWRRRTGPSSRSPRSPCDRTAGSG